MARYTYIPNRVIDSNGIADGASIYFYQIGTTTPITIYADPDMTVEVLNPVVVPAGAEVPAIYYREDEIRVRVVSEKGEVIFDDSPYVPLFDQEYRVGGNIAQAYDTKIQRLAYDIHDYYREDDGTVSGGFRDWTNAFIRCQEAMMAKGNERGDILITAGVYWVKGIDLYATVRLTGVGRGASMIRQVPGENRPVVQLANPNQYQCGIRHLTIVGNRFGAPASTDPANGMRRGISFDDQGGSGWPFYDLRHVIEDVEVVQTADTAVYMGVGGRESILNGMYVQQAGGHGYYLRGTDSVYQNLTSGAAGGIGIYEHGANNRLIGLKAFGSGRDGFQISGARNKVVGCEAQDNVLNGFTITSSNVAVASITSDSNGGYGVQFSNNSGVEISSVIVMDRVDRPHNHLAAFSFRNGASGNRVMGRAVTITSGVIFEGATANLNSLMLGDTRMDQNIVSRWATDQAVQIGSVAGRPAIALGNDVACVLDRSNSRLAVRANCGISPGTLTNVVQANALYFGSGAPTQTAPNGDFYLRTDGVAGSVLYHREAGAWVAIT